MPARKVSEASQAKDRPRSSWARQKGATCLRHGALASLESAGKRGGGLQTILLAPFSAPGTTRQLFKLPVAIRKMRRTREIPNCYIGPHALHTHSLNRNTITGISPAHHAKSSLQWPQKPPVKKPVTAPTGFLKESLGKQAHPLRYRSLFPQPHVALQFPALIFFSPLLSDP